MYLLVLVADPVDVLAGLHALIHKAVEATVQTTYDKTDTSVRTASEQLERIEEASAHC